MQTTAGLAVEGLISAPDEIVRPQSERPDQLLSVVTFDVDDPQPGLVTSKTLFSESSDIIFASQEHLFVFKSEWSAEDGTQTRMFQFAWDQGGAGLELVGTGVVPGRLINQFSADEFDGRLRVATTITSIRQGRRLSENNLYVLENHEGLLTTVGAVQGLAGGESIRSVRFYGERAFVVTFRDIDPLFDIDLRDPTRPVVRGQLKIAGFSSYMQVIDANHILAVGKNSVDGFSGPVQVSLFDISDPAHPRLIDNDTLPRFSTSLAEDDHHAFGWFPSHNTLAIPTQYSRQQRVDRDGDGFNDGVEIVSGHELLVFRIDVTQTGRSEAGILLGGRVVDDATILRSAFIDDVLYTISANGVIASDIHAPEQIIQSVDLHSTPTAPVFEHELLDVTAFDGAINERWLSNLSPASDFTLRTFDTAFVPTAVLDVASGAVQVTLPASTGLIRVTLESGELKVVRDGFEPETYSLSTATSLTITGTSGRDRVQLDFSQPGAIPLSSIPLSSITVETGEGADEVEITGLAKWLSTKTTVHGGLGNDVLRVGPNVLGGVHLLGDAGRDVLIGGVGRDSLEGGAGDDTLRGDRGGDVINGGTGNDKLYGDQGADQLVGGGGDNLLNGGSGDDTIEGGAGADTILGGKGNDSLMGGAGRDALAGGLGHDWLSGESDRDTLLGGFGDDTIRGGLGRDIVMGEAGNDDINGEQSTADTVSGGLGDDVITGRRSEIDEAFHFTARWLDLV